MSNHPPCYNWKANRLERVAAQMRARYLYTGSGCAAQRKAIQPGVEKPSSAEKPPQPLRRKPLRTMAWVERRKEYLIATGRLDQLRQEFGV